LFGVSVKASQLRAKMKREMDLTEERFCLNCGAALHGRPDKVFCNTRCKNEWHNRINGDEKRRRERVFGILWNNYKILETMLELQEHTPAISSLEDAGFRPGYITGFRKLRGRNEFRCFDITYNKTEARLYNIRRAPELM
jgi:predicted nucleic acid-binding Zn ribbon protein